MAWKGRWRVLGSRKSNGELEPKRSLFCWCFFTIFFELSISFRFGIARTELFVVIMKFNRETILLMLFMSLAMARPGLRSEVPQLGAEINGDNLWDFCNRRRETLLLVENIFYNYRIIVSAVIIFIGLFLCFLGKKSVKVAICLHIFKPSVQHVYLRILCWRHSHSDHRHRPFKEHGGVVVPRSLHHSQNQAFWISIGISCLMGVIVGVLLVCLYQIGNFVIGATLGVIIAVYTVVILDSLIRFHSDVVLYVSVAICALEFGCFALVWDQYAPRRANRNP